MAKLWEAYTEEELKEIYNRSDTQKIFLTELGYKKASSAPKGLKEKYDWYVYPKSIIGTKYGQLTIIGLDDEYNRTHRSIKYICKCDCGNICSVFSNNIRRGLTKSCGCLRSKVSSSELIRKNKERSKKIC